MTPTVVEAFGDFLSIDPILGQRQKFRIGVLLWGQIRKEALVRLGLGLALVGAEAVIEVVDHLRFV